MAEGGPLVNEEGRSSDRPSETTWVENDGDQGWNQCPGSRRRSSHVIVVKRRR